MPASLVVLSMRSIINNNLDFSYLSGFHQDIYLEMHKIKFKSTLQIIDIIYQEMKYIIHDYSIVRVSPVENDVYEDGGEFYDYIWVKYIHGADRKVSAKFIQEITGLDDVE